MDGFEVKNWYCCSKCWYCNHYRKKDIVLGSLWANER
jgi:hypothetical protein